MAFLEINTTTFGTLIDTEVIKKMMGLLIDIEVMKVSANVFWAFIKLYVNIGITSGIDR